MKRAPTRLLESASLSPLERRVLSAGRAARVDFDVAAHAERLHRAIHAGESMLASSAAHSSIAAASVKLACVLASVAGLGGAAYYALSERTAAPLPGESQAVVNPPASEAVASGPTNEVEHEPAAAPASPPHVLGSDSAHASAPEGRRSDAARRRRASSRSTMPPVASAKLIEPPAPVEPAPITAPPTIDTVQPSAPSSKSPLLMAELRDVARAWALLERNPSQALVLLEQLRVTHPQGFLLEERAALDVLALAATGQRDLAQRRTAEFLRRSPDSPFADRVRRAVKR